MTELHTPRRDTVRAPAAPRRSPWHTRLRQGGLALLVGAAALVAGCGGSTHQVSTFAPARLLVLGEESNVLDDSDGLHNARKWSINGVDSSGVRACANLPTLPQWVASHYGMVFAECNTGGASVSAYNYAVAGAMVDSGSNTLAQQLARAAPNSSDLVLVWFGVNDIVDIYRRWARGEYTWDAAVAEAERRGASAADRVNDLLSTGARALVVTAPDMGYSPYGRARVSSADPDDASVGAHSEARTLLSELSQQFNGYLRTRIDAKRFDGRNFGLVFADEAVAAFDATPTSYPLYLVSPYNVGDAACTGALLSCTAVTDSNGTYTDLVSGATYNGYVWAGSLWGGYSLHALLGAQAVSRLTTLPF